MVLPILGSPGGAIAAKGIASAVGGFVSKFGPSLLNFGANLFGGGGDRSNLERHAILRRVRDANEAGIHPLFALGASVGASPTFSTGSSLGDGLRAGAELFRDIRSQEEAKTAAGIDAEERALTRRLVEAQIRGANASAARDEVAAQVALSEAALQEQAAQAQLRDRIAARLDDVIPQWTGAFGTFPKPPTRLMRPVRVGNKTVLIPDQDIAETGELLGAGATAGGVGSSVWDSIRNFWQEAQRNRAARTRKSRRRGATGSW